MAFLSDIFGRVGRVARGQANAGVDALEDATFEATVKQTVADMKTELNNVERAAQGRPPSLAGIWFSTSQ